MATKQSGFTLLELMIAMAVIGILLAFALPSYQSYVQRGKLSEATATLADLRVKMEQYYQDNRNYGTAGGSCGVAMPTAPAAKYFTYTCALGTDAGDTAGDQSYRLTATGNASEGMSGYAFNIDQSNNKQTTAFIGASGLPASCWLMRKGDTC